MPCRIAQIADFDTVGLTALSPPLCRREIVTGPLGRRAFAQFEALCARWMCFLPETDVRNAMGLNVLHRINLWMEK
jgi:hypothetical protein